MARPTINFDKAVLVKAIQLAEEGASFNSRDAMFAKAIDQYKSLGGVEADKLTKILVYQRVKQWGLELKTVAGRKGRALGTKVERKPRVVTMTPTKQMSFAAVRSSIKSARLPAAAETRLNTLVSKVEKGSLKAAIKLNCLSCANFQREEVANCECYECPLFSLRPFQKG